MIAWPQQQIQEVAEGIIAICHGRGEAGVANAACVFEGKRALVVDTMTFPEMMEGMVQAITSRNASVEAVLNTHHHIDHTGGNRVFAGRPIVAHHATIRELERMARLPGSFYDQLLPQFGGRFTHMQIQVPDTSPDCFRVLQQGEIYAFQGAHSPADLAVWFPGSRVLLAGDLSFIGVTPMAAHGLLSHWIRALDTLIDLQPEVVIPGHGRIGTVQDLKDLRRYLASIFALGQRVVHGEMEKQDALRSIDAGPVADWIEAGRTALSLDRAIAEIRKEIHPDNLVALPVPHLKRQTAEDASHSKQDASSAEV